MGRGLIIGLSLSLAANVFMGGFIAGRLAHDPSALAPPGAFHVREFGGPAAQDPQVRDAFRKAFGDHRKEFRAHYHEVKKLRKEFTAVLGADEWDRAKAETLARQIEAHERSREKSMLLILVDVFDGLPAEKRKALAAEMKRKADTRRRSRHGRRSGDRSDQPPPPPPQEEPQTE
ncbi:MAG: periplasmic heavy metal sensor [Parvularculaceae bacterium]